MLSDYARKIIGSQIIANPYYGYMKSLAHTAFGIELLSHRVKALKVANDFLFIISCIDFHVFFREVQTFR